ncbi:MAG: hypothetical protein GYA51_12055 [Candidatus Methanofastidiosa archaeon]|nr:hypothetical protein [Candidatus Methanofastidiosa archaeon]
MAPNIFFGYSSNIIKDADPYWSAFFLRFIIPGGAQNSKIGKNKYFPYRDYSFFRFQNLRLLLNDTKTGRFLYSLFTDTHILFVRSSGHEWHELGLAYCVS